MNLPSEFIVRHEVPDPRKFNVYGPNALATTTPYDDCVTYPYQRKVWYASGRRWVFYVHASNFKYVSSTDGVTWAGPTNIRATTSTEHGRLVDTWVHNDGFLHYVYASETIGGEPRYRKGKLESDGSITWSAAEQTFSSIPSDSCCYFPSICVDANGYPWVGFYYFDPNPETRLAYIITSTTNDGTWTTNPNYGARGLQLNSASLVAWIAIPAPLANGTVVAYYGGTNATKFWARLCDGDGIGAEVEASSGGDWDNYYTGAAVASGNTVVAAFGSTDLTMRVCRWEDEAWASESTVQTGLESNTCPALSKDEGRGAIFLVWGNTTDDELRYKISWDEGVTWEPPGNTEYNVLMSISNGLDGRNRFSMCPEMSSPMGFAWTNTANNLEFGWAEPDEAPELKAVFEVGQDSADFLARFEVQGVADLLAKFEAQDVTDLLGKFDVGQDSAGLLIKFDVGQDSEDLLGITVSQHAAIAELESRSIIRPQSSSELLAKIDVMHWVDLKALFLIPRAYDFSSGMGISFEWWGSGGVDQYIDFEMWSLTGGWVGRFPDGAAEWRQVQLSWDDLTAVDLDGTRPDSSQIIGIYWTYHTPGVRRIDGIRAWMRQDLPCKVTIKNTSTSDLLSRFEAQASRDLLGKFEIQGFKDLKAKFVLREMVDIYTAEQDASVDSPAAWDVIGACSITIPSVSVGDKIIATFDGILNGLQTVDFRMRAGGDAIGLSMRRTYASNAGSRTLMGLTRTHEAASAGALVIDIQWYTGTATDCQMSDATLTVQHFR